MTTRRVEEIPVDRIQAGGNVQLDSAVSNLEADTSNGISLALTNSGDVTRSRWRTDLQELFELQLYVSTATERCCCNRVGGCLSLKGTFGSVGDRTGEMTFLIACDPLNMGGFIGRRFAGGDLLGRRRCAAQYDESAGSP